MASDEAVAELVRVPTDPAVVRNSHEFRYRSSEMQAKTVAAHHCDMGVQFLALADLV
jgi:hypothetical protein